MAKVKMYAALRESAGTSEAEIDVPNLAALLEKVGQIYGGLFSTELRRASVALNGVIIKPSLYGQTSIGPGDEVALLPPVSGGAPKVDEKRFKRAGMALSAVFCVVIGFASWLGAGPLAVLAVLASASLGVALAGSISNPHGPKDVEGSAAPDARLGRLAGVLGAAVFPVAVYFKGEHGLLWAGAGAILMAAPTMVFRGAIQGAAARAGTHIWVAFYAGLGLAYLVLIRQTYPGLRLLIALLLMVFAYKTARALAGLPAAGIAAAVLAALLALTFLQAPFTLWPMVIMGLVVGLACLLGEIGGRMVSRELSGFSLLLIGALDAFLVALPAFYYAFRLYLV